MLDTKHPLFVEGAFLLCQGNVWEDILDKKGVEGANG